MSKSRFRDGDTKFPKLLGKQITESDTGPRLIWFQISSHNSELSNGALPTCKAGSQTWNSVSYDIMVLLVFWAIGLKGEKIKDILTSPFALASSQMTKDLKPLRIIKDNTAFKVRREKMGYSPDCSFILIWFPFIPYSMDRGSLAFVPTHHGEMFS